MRKILKQLFPVSSCRRTDSSERLLASMGSVERLENRMMMAGDVSVSVTGNDLLITGTNAANDIEIYESNAGIVIQGHDDTTVTLDGVTADSHTLNLSVHDITLQMKKGDDVINIHDMNIGGQLIAKIGQGGDDIWISNTNVVQNIFVTEGTGSFSDAAYIDNVSVGGTLKVDLKEAPKHFLRSDQIVVTNSTVGTKLRLQGGIGSHLVDVHNVDVAGVTQVYTGDGDDTVFMSDSDFGGAVSVSTGGKHDYVQIGGAITADDVFTVFTGDGEDTVIADFAGSAFTDVVKLNGGNGDAFIDRLEMLSDPSDSPAGLIATGFEDILL